MAIIKQGDAPAQVRSIDRAIRNGRSGASAADPTALDLAEMEIARLRAEVDRLAARVVEAEAALPAARDESYRAGVAEGRSTSDQDHTAGLVRLSAGVDRAVSIYADAMEHLERLAPAIARAGLGKILGPTAAQSALVEDLLRDQLTRLERSAILRIEVSRRDFSDDQALAALAAGLAATVVNLEARDDLALGECRIRLTLGSLEVGPAQQWRLLDALLTDLAEGEGG